MTRPSLAAFLPAAAAVVGAATLTMWLLATSVSGVQTRLPGQNLTVAVVLKPSALLRNTGTTIPGPGKPSTLAGSWPQFRGADRTNIVHEALGLSRASSSDRHRTASSSLSRS